MEKIIVVNKPRGKTSRQVVDEYQRLYPGEKVGHAGTLDPLAEGLLIILVGKATKKQSQLMALEKEYLVEAVFGVTSPTWDLEGKLSLYPAKDLLGKLRNLTRKKVEQELKNFSGRFEQIVPAFSAVKVKGKRLYRLARKGKIEIKDLPRKEVKIYQIELVDFQPMCPFQRELTAELVLQSGPKARITMVVGKGVYVRSIIYQFGENLGVGATTTRLVRTRIGNFRLNSRVLLDTNGDQQPRPNQGKPFY